MRISCPNCSETYPIEAGFAEGDGKRLAVLFADMEPALGRAAISYLRLFKPPKTALRTTRAIKLLEQLMALVSTGTVCRDERTSARRQATQAMWAEGIEQMLTARDKLTLPLTNHHYLRAIVYTVADQADAGDEKQREEQLRTRSTRAEQPAPKAESPLQNQIAWLRQQLEYKLIDKDEFEQQATAARDQFGGQ